MSIEQLYKDILKYQDLEERLNTLEEQLENMVGSIQTLSTSEVPSGYLLCDGQEYLKTDYPKLYAKIGDVFGNTELGYTEPSSEEYFRVPNLLDRFLRNTDGTRPVGTNQTDTMRKIVGRLGNTSGDNDYPSGSFEIIGIPIQNQRLATTTDNSQKYYTAKFDSSKGIAGQEGTQSPNVGVETAPLNTTVIMVIKAK